MVIKPCTPAEIAFYETASAHPQFAHYMPTFMGTLSLTPHSDPSAAAAALTSSVHPAAQVPPAEGLKPATITDTVTDTSTTATDWTPSVGKTLNTSTAIVLSNLTYGFQRPNILDLKLGARLWADDAPLAKRQRLDAVAASSTSFTLGFRIAGMKVWQGRKATSVGKGEDLDVDAEGYKVYGKEYGRGFRSKVDVHRAFEEFLFVESAGGTQDLAKRVVARLLDEVTGLEAVLKGQESRMYSASILFVYEGDGEVLKKCFEMEEVMSREQKQPRSGEEDEGVGDDEDDEDEDSGPHTAVAKLIDFAHAEWVPGQGPDENALQGVRSVLDILKDLSTS